MPEKPKKNKSDPEGGMHGTYTSTSDKPAENAIKPKDNKTSKSTVSPAKKVIKPKDTRASGLRAKAVQGAKQVFSKGSQGQQAKEPQKPIELSEPLTPIRLPRLKPSETTQGAKKEEQKKTRVLSETTTPKKIPKPKSKDENTSVVPKTMSIEDIQSALQRAIDSKNPCDVIYLFRNNSKTMNEAVSSNRTDIINLIAKAVLYIEDKATRKTAYVIAKEKKNKEFLTFATNVTNKLAKLKPCTNIFLLKGKQAIGAGDKRVGESDVIWLSVLQDAIKRNELKNVIDVLVNNIQLISQYCKSDNRLQKKLYINKLSDSIKVKDDTGNNIFHVLASDESINEDKIKLLELLTDSNNATDIIYKVKNNKEETACAIATEQNNKTFLEIVKRKALQQVVSTDNSSKSASNTQTTPESPPSLLSDDSGMGLSWPPENGTLSRTESVNSILNDVEGSGSKDTVLPDWLDGKASPLSEERDILGSTLNSDAKTKPLTLLQSPVELSTDKNLHESDSNGDDDSGIDSPKKKSESKEDKEKTKLNHPTQTRPKGPNGQRPPSRPDKLFKTTEDHAQKEKPTPALIPEQAAKRPEPAFTKARDAKKAPDQVKEKLTPVVIPVPDTGIQGEENKIPASSTWMTLPRQEEEPIPALIPEQAVKSPVFIPEPDAEKVPDQVEEEPAPLVITEQAIENPTPDVIPASDARIQEEENQTPADTGMTEDNAEDQMVLSHQEETPDNEDNENKIEQQTTISNEDNNEGALFTKQSNNRNFYTAATAICTLGAVACFAIAGLYFMSAKKTELATSSIVVIGALCAIGVGFAITAAITSYFTPSTQVESMNINAHVNAEQTL